MNTESLKNNINKYIIRDLNTMIFNIPNDPYGGCSYPALMTLISLMELLGKIRYKNKKGKYNFAKLFSSLGENYNINLGKRVYEKYRSEGIAHYGLPTTNFCVSKNDNRKEHLKEVRDKGFVVNVKVMYEDFLEYYKKIPWEEVSDNCNKKVQRKINQLASGESTLVTELTRTTVSGTKS